MVEIIKPVRLQLSRKKGFRLVSPNGLPIVICSRPSKWGNPYRLSDYKIEGVKSREECILMQREMAARDYEAWIFLGHAPYSLLDIVTELGGKNLACWCGLRKQGEPERCHVDVLLRLAAMKIG